MRFYLTAIFIASLLWSCQKPSSPPKPTTPFLWENATVYFLLTDRFQNGDSSNDLAYSRQSDGGPLRSFMGGDIRGIIQKIDEGYFDKLGVNAIWFNPVFEQVHGKVDEGTGITYGYHGYWARDWTNIDENFGEMADLEELVQKAHSHGIRVLLDVVINHTGPVTDEDSQWPDTWVRTSPKCNYVDAETTISCTLVENLPDVKTESDEAVDLPQFLLDKWAAEGRLEKELEELNAFFDQNQLPRAPRFYIMKWLTDYVRKFGIDGYRVDTAKHTEASVWSELYKLASAAFDGWKSEHPDEVLDELPFFMVGEVYNYSLYTGLDYQYSDTEKINFFDNGFKSLINFSLKSDAAEKSAEEIFSYYASQLQGPLKEKTVLNYLASHDDGSSFDSDRESAIYAGSLLLLCPGQAQIYYGDETARLLISEGTVGDARLRTPMNWADTISGYSSEVLSHYRKLGQFRKNHPSIGAGIHQQIQEMPYTFSRTWSNSQLNDQVVVSLDYHGEVLNLGANWDGKILKDYYSGLSAEVKDGEFQLHTLNQSVLLLEETY